MTGSPGRILICTSMSYAPHGNMFKLILYYFIRPWHTYIFEHFSYYITYLIFQLKYLSTNYMHILYTIWKYKISDLIQIWNILVRKKFSGSIKFYIVPNFLLYYTHCVCFDIISSYTSDLSTLSVKRLDRVLKMCLYLLMYIITLWLLFTLSLVINLKYLTVVCLIGYNFVSNLDILESSHSC